MKQCPHCGEMVEDDVRDCRYCGEVLYEKLPEDAGTGPWRSGQLMVMHHESRMPGRCLKCNAPAVDKHVIRVTHRYHARWSLVLLITLILIPFTWGTSLLIAIVVVIFMGDKHNFNLPCCRNHKFWQGVYKKKARDELIWLKGVCWEYLNELPEWHG